jgi:pyruvate/2-oxoglutarate dehydrogenase complex dihydrolipoamide dehydrogenase (E3) component
MPEILGQNDLEISDMVRTHYTKKGIAFHLLSKVTRITANGTANTAGAANTADAANTGETVAPPVNSADQTSGGTVHFIDLNEQEHTVDGEKILISVGRRPNTTGFGLETLGVALNDRRGIAVDERMRPNIPGGWAAGDVSGLSMLAHTASREAEVAVNNIAGEPDTMSYDAIPGVVYTNPEVASVGLTYDAARAQGLPVRELRLPMSYSGRFVAENEGGEGICKVVVIADPSFEDDTTAVSASSAPLDSPTPASAASLDSPASAGTGTSAGALTPASSAPLDAPTPDGQLTPGRVVGVHMLGNPVGEMIWGACLAIEQGMTAAELQRIVFPHPTVAEVIKEALFTA